MFEKPGVKREINPHLRVMTIGRDIINAQVRVTRLEAELAEANRELEALENDRAELRSRVIPKHKQIK